MSVNPSSFAVLAATGIGDDNKQWIEVLPTATEARNGRFFQTITREDLDAYAESIRANADKLPVDYDHEGARDGGSTKAAGWFTGQARVVDTPGRGPILEAEVQWTPGGADSIRNGDFRMISAEYAFKNRDPKTGLLTKAARFIAATLTNRPYFTELAAVAAEMTDDELAVAAAELGVPVEKLLQVMNPTGGASASTEGDPVSDELKAIATKLGLPEDATADQITAAVTAAQTAATELATVKAERDELKASAGEPDRIEKLETALASERKLRIDTQRETILTNAVIARRIEPAAKEVLASSFGDNIEGLQALIETFPAKPAKAAGSGGAGRDDDSTTLEPDVAEASKRFQQGADSASPVTATDEQLTAHVKAEKALAEQGKQPGEYTTEEYVKAYARAERELAAA